MDRFLIKGGKALRGTVAISGAKNSALPAMAAALLTEEQVTLHNIPKVRDLITMSKLLAFMGARVSVTEMPASDYALAAPALNHAEAPYELVKTMRASILTLGPLMARTGVARVSLPGGCAIGARPVDLHLSALEKMGAEIATEHGYIQARAPKGGRLNGAHIVFEKITVTGTENVLMAAALADGETVLENAAREPEVTDLVVILRKMGAQIEGDGTSTLRIGGDYRRRLDDYALCAGTFGRGDCEIEAGGRANRGGGYDNGSRAVREEAGRCGCDDRRVPGICNGHAGTVHGAGDAGGRHVGDYGNDL